MMNQNQFHIGITAVSNRIVFLCVHLKAAHFLHQPLSGKTN